MGFFQKKPVVIEATILKEDVIIETLEGPMKGSKGDYLITGIKGEKYACKPDIFRDTYEEVSQEVYEEYKRSINHEYET